MSISSAAKPVAAPTPLDLDHLARQTFGDRDLQAELLDLFAEQAKRLISALGQSLATPASAGPVGQPRAAELLHTLCGSARAIGSWDVAQRAEALERDLRYPCGPTPPPDRLAALEASVGEVCAAIGDLSHAGA